MNKKLCLLLSLLTALLTACASHVEGHQCYEGDWHQKGYQDGRQGRPVEEIDHLQKTCAQAGTDVDSAGYLTGWHRGIVDYCKPNYQMGEADGKAGKPKPNFAGRRKFCQQYAMKFDPSHYQLGYSLGQRQRKTP